MYREGAMIFWAHVEGTSNFLDAVIVGGHIFRLQILNKGRIWISVVSLFDVFYHPFKNSLIIHNEKTKEIVTMTVF